MRSGWGLRPEPARPTIGLDHFCWLDHAIERRLIHLARSLGDCRRSRSGGGWSDCSHCSINSYWAYSAVGSATRSFKTGMCGSGVIRHGFYRAISSYSSFNSLRARCGDAGPDFRFERDGVTVSVEAIAPEPRSLPDHWLPGSPPGSSGSAACRMMKCCCAGRQPSRRNGARITSKGHRRPWRRLRDRDQRRPARLHPDGSWHLALAVSGRDGVPGRTFASVNAS